MKLASSGVVPGRRGLVALFFFPGVGVADDEVGEGEGAGGFLRCDEAVDGLSFPGEGVGGCSRPGGGQGDGARGFGVWAIEPGSPSVWWRVVVADQLGISVGVHPLFVSHT